MPCLLRQSHSAPVPSRNPSQGRGFAKSLPLPPPTSLPITSAMASVPTRLPQHPSPQVLLLPAVPITSSCHLSVQSLHSASTPWRNPSQGRGYAISFHLHSASHVCYPHPSPSRPPATCGHQHVLLPPFGPIASFRLHSMAQPLPRSGIRYIVPSPFRGHVCHSIRHHQIHRPPLVTPPQPPRRNGWEQ